MNRFFIGRCSPAGFGRYLRELFVLKNEGIFENILLGDRNMKIKDEDPLKTVKYEKNTYNKEGKL